MMQQDFHQYLKSRLRVIQLRLKSTYFHVEPQLEQKLSVLERGPSKE